MDLWEKKQDRLYLDFYCVNEKNVFGKFDLHFVYVAFYCVPFLTTFLFPLLISLEFGVINF